MKLGIAMKYAQFYTFMWSKKIFLHIVDVFINKYIFSRSVKHLPGYRTHYSGQNVSNHRENLTMAKVENSLTMGALLGR
jgi:hypothetical protein